MNKKSIMILHLGRKIHISDYLRIRLPTGSDFIYSNMYFAAAFPVVSPMMAIISTNRIISINVKKFDEITRKIDYLLCEDL